MATTPRLGLHLVEDRYGQEYFLNRNMQLLDVFASRVISSIWGGGTFFEEPWVNPPENGKWGLLNFYPSEVTIFDGNERNALSGFYDASIRTAGKAFNGFTFFRLYSNEGLGFDEDMMTFVESAHVESLAITGGTPNSGSFRLEIATPGQSSDPQNERQQLQIDATDGTYRLRFGGEDTAPLNVFTLGSRDQEISTALLALSTIPANSIFVSFRAGNTSDTRLKMTLSRVGSWTGGTYTLGFRGGETAAIAWNATASTIRSRLLALPGISSVNASGGPLSSGVDVVLDFINPDGPQPLITLEDNSLTGTGPSLGIAETQAADLRMEIEFENALGDTDVDLIEVTDASVSGAGADVNVTLIQNGSLGGTLTEPIAWNATAADVQEAVRGLPSFDEDTFSAAGGPLPGTPIVMSWGGRWSGVLIDVSTVNSTLNAGSPVATPTAYGASIFMDTL